MRIEVDDKWCISASETQWAVYRTYSPENEVPKSYHGTFAQAIQSLANRQIRLADADTLIEAIAETNRITEKFKGLLQFDE